MTIRILLHIVLALLVCSCASYSDEMETVLRMSGKNRGELEKVLKRYGKHPADSLKLRAAEFLIVNMPGKCSVFYDAPWNDAATVFLRWTSSSDKQMVLDEYQLGEKIGKYDLLHITGDYLINHIELAFKVWEEMPWGKDIPFDVFCEEILPCRIGNEPLENWREKVLACYSDLYDLFRDDTTGITPFEACCRMVYRMPRLRLDKDFPHMSFSQLMASTRGTCPNMAHLAIFGMRGMGIPVTYDFSLLQYGFASGHTWNCVNNGNNAYHPFMGTESSPEYPVTGTDIFKAKVYRKVYADQRHVILDKENIPPLLHGINHMIDVTAEYDCCTDVRIPVQNPDLNKTGYVFLAIFHNRAWQPIGWGLVENDSMRFQSVNSGLYMPVYYQKGHISPASNPFFIDSIGGLHMLRPDTKNTVSLSDIRYMPDAKETGIYKGHVYELFYWEGNDWQSLGEQTAIGHTLQYEAPANALFMLENVSLKKANSKLFYVDDGGQRWVRYD